MSGFALVLRPRSASGLADLAQALLWRAAAGWLLPVVELPRDTATLLAQEEDAGDRTLYEGPLLTPAVLEAARDARAATFWCALAVRLPGAPSGRRKPTLRMGAPERSPICELEVMKGGLRLRFPVRGAPFAVPPTSDEAWRHAAQVAREDLVRAVLQLDAEVEPHNEGLAPAALAPLREGLQAPG